MRKTLIEEISPHTLSIHRNTNNINSLRSVVSKAIHEKTCTHIYRSCTHTPPSIRSPHESVKSVDRLQMQGCSRLKASHPNLHTAANVQSRVNGIAMCTLICSLANSLSFTSPNPCAYCSVVARSVGYVSATIGSSAMEGANRALFFTMRMVEPTWKTSSSSNFPRLGTLTSTE
jgi:hypothetical protein